MKHEPSDGDVGIAQALEKRFDIVQHIFFEELTVNHIAIEALKAILDHKGILFCDCLHIAKIDVVLDCLSRCWEGLPVLSEISEIALIDLHDKIVREVLVSNFSHFGLLKLQNSRRESEQDKNVLCLLSKSHRSVAWIWISAQLVVKVVILKRIYDRFD